MKPQEILLASALIAAVSGVGAALATHAFRGSSARSEPDPRSGVAQAAPGGVAGGGDALQDAARRAIDELRLENARLVERLGALEARLVELQTTRTPVATAPEDAAAVAASLAAPGAGSSAALEVTPEFVASVGRALDSIRAREEEEREAKRKELQAQRIEERVTRLQTELGLNHRQASELRTALIQQDDKREALFAAMRDSEGDPRQMRDGFRALRDETNAAIQGFLTPEQYAAYQKSEESEFGRRGFGDFGGPGGGPPDGGGRRGR